MVKSKCSPIVKSHDDIHWRRYLLNLFCSFHLFFLKIYLFFKQTLIFPYSTLNSSLLFQATITTSPSFTLYAPPLYPKNLNHQSLPFYFTTYNHPNPMFSPTSFTLFRFLTPHAVTSFLILFPFPLLPPPHFSGDSDN